MGKHEVLRDRRVRAWDDMSTDPLCELFHTLVIFSACYTRYVTRRRKARPSRARRALVGGGHNARRHTHPRIAAGASGEHRFRRDRIRSWMSLRSSLRDWPRAES